MPDIFFIDWPLADNTGLWSSSHEGTQGKVQVKQEIQFNRISLVTKGKVGKQGHIEPCRTINYHHCWVQINM